MIHLQPEKASKFISHPQAENLTTGFTADLTIPVQSQTTLEVPTKRRRTSPSTDSDILLQQGKTSTLPSPPRTILKPPPPPLSFIPPPSSFSKFSTNPLLCQSVFVDSSSILANNHSIPSLPILTKTQEFIHASLSRAICDEQLQKI